MRFLTIALLFLSLSATAQTAEDSLRVREKVDTLMEVMNSSEGFLTAMDQMIDIQVQQFAGTDLEETMREVFQKFRAEALVDYETTLVPEIAMIYLRHYSEVEIDGLIAFYRTELGQSTLRKQPLIMQESMQVGASWGQELAQEILKTIRDNRD